MKSASELFLEMREREVNEGIASTRKNEAIVIEYKNGKSFKKFNSADEEMELRRDQESDERFNGKMMEGEL